MISSPFARIAPPSTWTCPAQFYTEINYNFTQRLIKMQHPDENPPHTKIPFRGTPPLVRTTSTHTSRARRKKREKISLRNRGIILEDFLVRCSLTCVWAGEVGGCAFSSVTLPGVRRNMCPRFEHRSSSPGTQAFSELADYLTPGKFSKPSRCTYIHSS